MRARGLVLVLTTASIVLPAGAAAAHGTMQWPPSRTWTCWTESPERPTSEACRAAIALRGPQPAYDWNEVNLPDPATPSPTTSPTATPTPTPSPTPTHTHGTDAWLAGVRYYRGDSVVHEGIPYTCLQSHVSQVDWSPTAAPALWLRAGQRNPGWAAV